MHFPIAMEAIRRGKPVMVQKPLSNNLWETRALANYAKEKGVLTVMGNQGATMQGTRLLREWIEAGLIGDTHSRTVPRRARRGTQAGFQLRGSRRPTH
jgi:predicted dehydrogenase